MTSVRWNLKGADFDVREAARAAARRAGMSLGEWLEEAIAARAARLGIEPDELNDAEKIEAIAARLGALTLDDYDHRPRAAAGRRAPAEDASRPRRQEVDLSLLDAAASSLGLRRIADSLFDEPAGARLRRPAALDRIEPLSEPPPRAPRQKKPNADLELHALRQQIDDLSRAVAIVGDRAAKQSVEPALLDLLERIEASRANGVMDEALAPVMETLVEIRAALENSPAAIARAIRDQLAGMQARIDGERRENDRASLEAMRGKIESLARSLADLVIRLASQETLEQQIQMLSRRVEEIAEAPRDIAGRIFDFIRDMSQRLDELDASPALRSLERRIDDIARDQGEDVHALATRLDAIRATIDGLAENPALASMRRQIQELTALTGAIPTRLVERLEGLRDSLENIASNPALLADAMRPAPPGNIAESLAEIRLSIERLAANAGFRLLEDQTARLQTIEERVCEISQKLDAPPAVERLAGMQEALLSHMERLRSDMPSEQIAALRARVEELHQALAKPRPEPATDARLETLLGQITSRLDRTASASAGAHDPRALQAIENQVLRIAEKLERHGEAAEAIGALERSMSELATQVDDARHAAAEAVNAGRAAARDETERQTRSTLEAVHETLEKVVDRLALIESDVGALRSRPEAQAQEPAPAAPFTVPERREPPEAPVGRAAPAGPGARHDVALEFSEPRAAQKSFIAAARRATQLMGAAPPPPPRGDDEETGPRRGGSLSAVMTGAEGAVDSLIGAASRKIMLGAAGVALAVGAYQAATRDAGDAPSPIPQRAEASAAPAEFAAAPEPAQPAKPAPMAETDRAPVGSISRADLAITLLRNMAESGSAAAQFELAARLSEGRGMMRDATQAARWFQRSAEQNYAPAQYRLGALYEKGTGVDRSARLAALWYSKAAEAGHVRAMHNLGVLLAEGVEGRPDYAAAAALFRRAGEHGLRDSQYNLAVLLVRGLGVDANLVEAYKWFSLAGAQGDMDALGKRDEVAGRLHPGQLNEARRAAETFALRTPDPSANEPVSFDALVAGPRASADPEPAPAPSRNKGEERVTSLR